MVARTTPTGGQQVFKKLQVNEMKTAASAYKKQVDQSMIAETSIQNNTGNLGKWIKPVATEAVQMPTRLANTAQHMANIAINVGGETIMPWNANLIR